MCNSENGPNRATSSEKTNPDNPIDIAQNESALKHQTLPWDQILPRLKYNDQGLIPAIAQQHDSKEVLMMAWMNQAAIEESLSVGYVCYWSRSRGALWRKGERSGNRQQLLAIDIDCDGDTLLLSVNQEGPACHTGRRSCFYNQVDPAGNQLIVKSDPIIDPKQLYPS